jgi:hypothetical protein
MKILEIGSCFETTSKVDYSSDQTILEYDAIIIDFDALLKGSLIPQADKLFIKRKNDLIDFVRYKNIPIVYFVPLARDIKLFSNDRIISKNLDFFAPIPELSIVNESGNNIRVISKTIFTDFLDKYKTYLSYRAFFASSLSLGKTILETELTKKILGFYTNECVFLPKPKVMLGDGEVSFLNDLYLVLKSVSNTHPEAELPIWSHEYHLPGEENVADEINLIDLEIKTLNEKREEKTMELLGFSYLKRLFTSSGKELELVVEKVFRDLGFELLESQDNRDDLIVRYNENIAVIEIKGVTKSAAEKHSAQLEKWAAKYLEENGVQPKPILIVNSFLESPLNERTEKTFPDQMLKYSNSRSHCLLTTTQLLGLFYKINSEPSRKDILIESLFKCTGVFSEFQNWSSFITFKSEERKPT